MSFSSALLGVRICVTVLLCRPLCTTHISASLHGHRGMTLFYFQKHLDRFKKETSIQVTVHEEEPLIPKIAKPQIAWSRKNLLKGNITIHFPGFVSFMEESQNGWGSKGTLEVIWSNLSSQAELPRGGCPRPWADGFWIYERWRIYSLCGQPVLVISYSHFLYFKKKFKKLFKVPKYPLLSTAQISWLDRPLPDSCVMCCVMFYCRNLLQGTKKRQVVHQHKKAPLQCLPIKGLQNSRIHPPFLIHQANPKLEHICGLWCQTFLWQYFSLMNYRAVYLLGLVLVFVFCLFVSTPLLAY